MKMLRSQYLKLQHSGACEVPPLNNNVIAKKILNEGTEQSNNNHKLAATTSNVQVHGLNTCFQPNAGNIKILIDNVDESLRNLNVIVEFTYTDPLWLTGIYKTYENYLWHKKKRLFGFGRKKWFFHCGLCTTVYKTYTSMKGHLNQHINFYPYVCKLCLKKFTVRKSAIRHLKCLHKLDREQWNDFLTN